MITDKGLTHKKEKVEAGAAPGRRKNTEK